MPDHRAPLVSILCPVWNEETHFAQMVSSLQSQGYEAWELVVVDDGSSDNTLSIIRDIAAREPRVRLVGHGERLGKVKAFNLAAARADGALICHLGGDDLATEDALTA